VVAAEQVLGHTDHGSDLGPDAGAPGGRVVLTGPPASPTEAGASVTGEYLRRVTAEPAAS
jgi:excinuclease UvrABC ATPase subunit